MKNKNEKPAPKDLMIWILLYAVSSMAVARLFYDSFVAAFAFVPFYYFFAKYANDMKRKKRKQELTGQFLRSVISVSSCLSAGMSAENSFAASYRDMAKMYGKRSQIVRELEIINSRVATGQRLEKELQEFAKRSGIEEIHDFAVVFSTAKENGTDLSTVISSCTRIMEDRIASENEARVLIRAKQYEQRIMCLTAPGILVYLRLSSGSYIEVLYHNTFGILVMTACLIVCVLAFLLGERMVSFDDEN